MLIFSVQVTWHCKFRALCTCMDMFSVEVESRVKMEDPCVNGILLIVCHSTVISSSPDRIARCHVQRPFSDKVLIRAWTDFVIGFVCSCFNSLSFLVTPYYSSNWSLYLHE